MADTTKYGWTKPTVGGSSGAWGGIINAAMDDIDADLYPLVGKLSEVGLLDLTGARSQSASVQVDAALIGFTIGAGPCFVPIPFAKPGVRITAFTSRNDGTAPLAGTVKLVHYDNTGTETVVSAGHSTVVGSAADTTTSGLTHDCVTGKRYFIRIDVTGASGDVNIRSLSVAVQASP